MNDTDEHYGHYEPEANPQPDSSYDQYEKNKNEFLIELKETNDKMLDLEKWTG